MVPSKLRISGYNDGLELSISMDSGGHVLGTQIWPLRVQVSISRNVIKHVIKHVIKVDEPT
jgi:hypothetical protein